MSSPFGDDSFDIQQELRKLLPQIDSLQDTPFFPHLAVDLSAAQDAAAFDDAYESAVEAVSDSSEYGWRIPSHFDRRILLALCSNTKLLEAWARRHYSFVVLSHCGLAAVIRFTFWNRWLWPMELAIYIPLAISFGAGILKAVFGIDVTDQALQLSKVILAGFMVAWVIYIIVLLQGAVMAAILTLLQPIATGMDRLLDWDRMRSINRHTAREAAKQVSQAAAQANKP